MKRMTIRGGLSTMLIAAALLVGAPAAMAQLPGGSAVDQYTENVPGAGGDQPGGGTNSGSGGPSSGSTDGSTPAGTAPSATAGSPSSPTASNLSEGGGGVGGGRSASTGQGPGGATTSTGGSPSGAGVAQGDVPATLTSQPVPASADRPGGGSGVGAGWPIALGVVLAACAGIYWYRRRYPETLIQRSPQRAPQRLPS